MWPGCSQGITSRHGHIQVSVHPHSALAYAAGCLNQQTHADVVRLAAPTFRRWNTHDAISLASHRKTSQDKHT